MTSPAFPRLLEEEQTERARERGFERKRKRWVGFWFKGDVFAAQALRRGGSAQAAMRALVAAAVVGLNPVTDSDGWAFPPATMYMASAYSTISSSYKVTLEQEKRTRKLSLW